MRPWDSESVLTGGWYRNQFWFVPGPLGDLQLCLGIHGQMVLVDRATRTVSVKLSSWPSAQDAAALIDTIRAFVAAGRHLAGLAGSADVGAHEDRSVSSRAAGADAVDLRRCDRAPGALPMDPFSIT